VDNTVTNKSEKSALLLFPVFALMLELLEGSG
jgi:hypothetical protein